MEADMPYEVRADRPIPSAVAQALIEALLGQPGAREKCPYSHRISQPLEPSNIHVLHLRCDMTRYGAITYTAHMLKDLPIFTVTGGPTSRLFTPEAVANLTELYGADATKKKLKGAPKCEALKHMESVTSQSRSKSAMR